MNVYLACGNAKSQKRIQLFHELDFLKKFLAALTQKRAASSVAAVLGAGAAPRRRDKKVTECCKCAASECMFDVSIVGLRGGSQP